MIRSARLDNLFSWVASQLVTRNKLQVSSDLMGMSDIENKHHNEDEQCIKHIQVNLMMQKVALIALYVFHKSKGWADEDQEAGYIENVEVFSPLDFCSGAPWDRVFVQLQVEKNSDNDEKAEKYDLDKKASYYHPLSSFHAVQGSTALHSSSWIEAQHLCFSNWVHVLG